jgi:hypothetical protein
MNSSHDDFSLLLNKWISESKELLVVMLCTDVPSGPKRCIAVVVGKLVDLDDETLSIRDGSGSCAMVRYSNCQFTYQSELGGHGVADLTGRQVEDVFFFTTPTGIMIAVGSTTSPASSSG